MIQLQHISKSYGQSHIFDDLTFAFDDTGLTCLIGPSGGGKTTLLNMLAGFDRDYKGEITVLGESISGMNADELCSYRRDHIGFVFQNYNLLSGYTVLENVLLASELNGVDADRNRKNAEELLLKLGLSSKISVNVENLSGGQKQRVAIVRALINTPSIILADEPTGALDRTNAAEIMKLLKEIASDRLVIVITHDHKNCEIADQIVRIAEGRLISSDRTTDMIQSDRTPDMIQSAPKDVKGKKINVSTARRGWKNFNVHLLRNLAVSLAISIGVLCFMLSLSSGNVLSSSIESFKQKNTAFNNGFIMLGGQSDPLDILNKDPRIENAYYQYKLENVALTLDGKKEILKGKVPNSKATTSMAYGVMPRVDEGEIALSPSLAKKISADISKLIGKTLHVEYGGKQYEVVVSGIFDGSFDDFMISSDLEKAFYQQFTSGNQPYSISYDVKNFDDIVAVSEILNQNNIKSKNAAKEVDQLQQTFHNINRLFLIVSILILGAGLLISTVLLIKLQNSRYTEMGLLSALGFGRTTINKMIVIENMMLAGAAILLQLVLTGIVTFMSGMFELGFLFTGAQIVSAAMSTGAVVVCIGFIASYKLVCTEPAVALRK